MEDLSHVHLKRIVLDDVPRIERGIVFIDANWSGQSRRVQGLLEQVLLEFVPVQLDLYLIDIDTLDTLQGTCTWPEVLRTKYIGGYGEIFWVREGQVIRSNWDLLFPPAPPVQDKRRFAWSRILDGLFQPKKAPASQSARPDYALDSKLAEGIRTYTCELYEIDMPT